MSNALSAAALAIPFPSNPSNQTSTVNFIKSPARTGKHFPRFQHKHTIQCSLTTSSFSLVSSLPAVPSTAENSISDISYSFITETLVILDLDPATAKLAIGFLGPFLSAFGFLFIVRIVMSWYPKLPVEKFPYAVAYAPTEPILSLTRKVIPPLGGVDVTPVVWFGLISFLNEILVGPQGLLVILSQQKV